MKLANLFPLIVGFSRVWQLIVDTISTETFIGLPRDYGAGVAEKFLIELATRDIFVCETFRLRLICRHEIF